MNFIRYKYEVFVAVILQLLSSYFSIIFSNIIFHEYFLTCLFFIHYFVGQCVFCFAIIAKLRFTSVK